MSGPEQAATVTPAQAAYEAWCGSFPGGYLPWNELDGELRAAWEAAAKAVVPGYRMLVDEARALVAEILGKFKPTDPDEPHGRYAAVETAAMLEHWQMRAGIAPAVTFAGAEHLAEKIRGLAIPDEEN